MAKIEPSFENINRLKVKPTDGELYLLHYLVDNLASEYEVFFNHSLMVICQILLLCGKGLGLLLLK